MTRYLLTCGVLGLFLVAGCGGSVPSGGVLNQLGELEDSDADGFADITPPEGVEFNPEQTLALSLENDITLEQAEEAVGADIPGMVEIVAKVSVLLTYADGTTQELDGNFTIEPFDVQFELACPETIEIQIDVVANVPLVGEQPVTSFPPFVVEEGEGPNDFQCGTTITIATFIDEDGNPMSTIDIQ